jgi:hypothetical protein
LRSVSFQENIKTADLRYLVAFGFVFIQSFHRFRSRTSSSSCRESMSEPCRSTPADERTGFTLSNPGITRELDIVVANTAAWAYVGYMERRRRGSCTTEWGVSDQKSSSQPENRVISIKNHCLVHNKKQWDERGRTCLTPPAVDMLGSKPRRFSWTN